jgi:Adenylate and Guanylate cyclase catalytic domain
MKRIRRRTKRTNSNSSLRRSISHPPNRPGMQCESGDESGGSSSEVEVETSEDLEAGCSTKEKPKSVTIASDVSHKKDDDQHNRKSNNDWNWNWKARVLMAVSMANLNLGNRLHQLRQKLWDEWSEFVHGVPLLLKVAWVLHGLVSIHVISIVYAYHYDHHGTLGAIVLATCTTLALLFTALVTVAASHTATIELSQLMDQQVRSRAILNTLYPTRVLEQMYLELTPEQMEQAQEQVLTQLDSAAAAAEQPPQERQLMSDESILLHQEELQEESIRLQQERKDSFHSSLDSLLERTASSRSLVVQVGDTRSQRPSFNRRVVEIDAKTLEYDNADDVDVDIDIDIDPPTSSPPAARPNHKTTSHADRNNDVFCIKRNSLTMRRLSMSRRASLAQQSQEQQRQRRCTMSFSPARRRKSSVGSSASSATSVGRPIQERFDPTTVLLADIAGFTSWCSQREPTQVFHLLESVFFAFDNLAKQLNVYKIETIGDWYVRVVELGVL